MSDTLPGISNPGEKEYETLYSGSKHYWKARCHVDYTIMWHKSAHFVEIAAFNVDLHEESERIFADAEKLFSMVDKEEVESKVRAKQEELMRQRKPRVLSEELAKTITAQMAVQLLVQRAVFDPSPPEGVKFRVIIQPQTGDQTLEGNPKAIFFIRERPENFEDTPITRKKKASASEFRQTLMTLKQDSKKLSAECNKAARKAGLAKSACSAFVSNKARYTYDPERMSAAKIRFLKAGRRIIALNCVRKVTALLERLERASMGELPSPTKAEFAAQHGMFPSIVGSPSLDNLSEMTLQNNGRRAARPHHKLKPVRRAVRRSRTITESEERVTVPELAESASTPIIGVV